MRDAMVRWSGCGLMLMCGPIPLASCLERRVCLWWRRDITMVDPMRETLHQDAAERLPPVVLHAMPAGLTITE